MAHIRSTIYNILAEESPATCRSVFYQCVSAGVVEKLESEYTATVCRLLGDMRRAGEIPFEWVTDNTRWAHVPQTYASLEEAIKDLQDNYLLDYWQNQPEHVEIWTEKDAMVGVLYPETSQWHIPLQVTRGYPSISYLHSTAQTIAAKHRPAHIFYLGDHDPSGTDISRATEEGLREFAPNAEIYFERIAVTREQIAQYNLPTRPTKETDRRRKNFKGDSVEVDALRPSVVRSLVQSAIAPHMDPDLMEVIERRQKRDDKTLQGLFKKRG
jgi:hypothetical protein